MPRFCCKVCNPPVGITFVSPQAKCPNCGHSGVMVFAIANVHWIKHNDDGTSEPACGARRDLRKAITPNMTSAQREALIAQLKGEPNFGSGGMDFDFTATGECHLANCPACRKTAEWKQAMELWAMLHPGALAAWESNQPKEV